jgi:hypothetical protein
LQSEFGATPFGATPFGPAESEASPKSLAAKEEFVAEMKLKLFLDALAGYLNSTVYDNENLLGGPPPGGPMGGMMMGAGGSNHAAGPDFRPAATTNDPPPGASPAADQLR